MRKLIIWALSLAMLVSLLGGCGGSDEKESTGEDGQITITIGLPLRTNVEDYDTNAFTEWLEETTGYNLEFETFQSNQADYASQLSTRMLSGEKLPDILFNFELGTEVYEQYGEDGWFIDLKPYLYDMEKSQVWWDSFNLLDEEYRNNVMRRMTHDNGAIYVFPRVEESEVDIIDSMAFINKTWLEELELEMPTDTESLYQVLKAFKTQDPNGNNLADEIPLLGRADSTYGDATDWLVNMFLYHDNQRHFCVDENNKLYLPSTTDAYREALIYIHKLVAEGLMDSNCWAVTNENLMGLVNPVEGVDQTVGIFLGHPSLVLEAGNDAVYDYAAIPFMGYALMNENANYYNTFITEDCKNVDAAWEVLMAMASPEGAIRMRYGEEGVDWVTADAGTTSFLGYEAQIKILNEGAYSQRGNQTWNICDATILRNAENETAQLSDDMNEWTKAKMNLMKDIHDYAWSRYEADGKNPDACPVVLLNEKETKLTEQERDNCASFITACRASFSCGSGAYNDPSDDSQWKAYLTELEKMGLQKWINQYQRLFEEQHPDYQR